MSRGSTRKGDPESSAVPGSCRGRVGVFDSGIGGISVLRAIHGSLPRLDLLYVADTAHAPYGCLRGAAIRQRARRITEFLFQQGAEAVVLACNSATASAVQTLRRMYSQPLVGMEPAIKPALRRTRTGGIGVLATEVTLESERFHRLLQPWKAQAELLLQPCPDLVREVELGNWDGARTRRLLEAYVHPLLAAGADTLVLGCTHYHFLKPALSRIAGPETVILDPSYPVARQLARVLSLEGASCPEGGPSGVVRFWTSGDPLFFRKQLDRVWAPDTRPEKLPF